MKRSIPASIQAQADQFSAARRGWSGPIGMSMETNDDAQSGDTEGAEQPAALPTAEDLAAMSPEDVDAALQAAHDEAASIRETDPADMSDDQVDRLEALADFTDLVTADSERRAQEAADRQARVDAANERLDAGNGGDGEPGDGDEGEGDDQGDGGDGGQEGDGDAGDGEGAQSIAAAAGAPAPRPAPQRTPSRVRSALSQRRAPEPRPAAETDTDAMVSIVAAAEGTGFSGGQVLSGMAEAAAAFTRRSSAFPQGRPGVFAPLPVVEFQRNFDQTPDGLYQGNPDFADDYQVLLAAANESRLPDGSLVASVRAREAARENGTLNSLTAAGGWCAPSTTQYGLCQAETLDGIVEIPEVGVPRGGINYTEGPDFADIYTDAGFSQTEAEAIAGETKDCVEISCPDFGEVRLDAVGICVRAPLLTRTAYPELIERWVSGTVVANAHKVGARVVTQMATLLGSAPSLTLTATPITWGLTTALEFIVEQERKKRRLARGETWEVILPHWAPAALRADLANRNGVDERSVSRAQVMQHFTDRDLAPQFVYGLQDLGDSATAFPATVDALVYPAGTFVKGTQDVISLDTVYDNPSLVQNMYTAAFVEDGVLVAKMCPGGRKVTVPALPSGRLGAADLNDPWGSAQA